MSSRFAIPLLRGIAGFMFTWWNDIFQIALRSNSFFASCICYCRLLDKLKTFRLLEFRIEFSNQPRANIQKGSQFIQYFPDKILFDDLKLQRKSRYLFNVMILHKHKYITLVRKRKTTVCNKQQFPTNFQKTCLTISHVPNGDVTQADIYIITLLI